MQAQAPHSSGAAWWPDATMLASANLTRFMRALGVNSFEARNQQASADAAGSHDALIPCLDYRFYEPYSQALDTSEGLPFVHWCVGGMGPSEIEALLMGTGLSQDAAVIGRGCRARSWPSERLTATRRSL